MATSSKGRVPREHLVKNDLKKSRVEGNQVGPDGAEVVEPQASKFEEVKTGADDDGTEDDSAGKEFLIGETFFTMCECMQKSCSISVAKSKECN